MHRILSVSLGLLLAAVFAISASLATAPAANAAASIPDALQHIIDCAGWMFTDPARHAAECAPGHEYTGQFSHAWGMENAPPSSSEPPIQCDGRCDGDCVCNL